MPTLISPSSLAGCQCDTEAEMLILKDPCILVTAKGINVSLVANLLVFILIHCKLRT